MTNESNAEILDRPFTDIQTSQDARALGLRVAADEVQRTRMKAVQYEMATRESRIIRPIAINKIEANYLTRDRAIFDTDLMEELKSSIKKNGQRLPIEVVAFDDGGETKFGIVSGWRRFTAIQELHQETGEQRYTTIKAIIRNDLSRAQQVVAMVEENEIRENLSLYERGRAVVNAVQLGEFENDDKAIGALFASASKSKRSKIRSFVTIHEQLGDSLKFATQLTERHGLTLSKALKNGLRDAIRNALSLVEIESHQQEWSIIQSVIHPEKPKQDDHKRIRLSDELELKISKRDQQLKFEFIGAESNGTLEHALIDFLSSYQG